MPSFLDKGFSGQWPEKWSKWFGKYKDRKTSMLELGCWDGRSSYWFLKNILVHPESVLVVVDTFEGGEDHKAAGIDCSNLRQRFESNLKEFQGKVVIYGTYTFLALIRLCELNLHKWKNKRKEPGSYDSEIIGDGYFDIVCVDASHLAYNVLEDTVLAWRLLKQGGLLFWDDYNWHTQPTPNEVNEPKIAIDSFLKCYEGQYKIVDDARLPDGQIWQICIEKE